MDLPLDEETDSEAVVAALCVVVGRAGVVAASHPLPPAPGWKGPVQMHMAASRPAMAGRSRQAPTPSPAPSQAAIHFSVSLTAWQTSSMTFTQSQGAGVVDASDVVTKSERFDELRISQRQFGNG